VDRIQRNIANKKQDKIRVINNSPSSSGMREGEEVLYFSKDGQLSRYRKERGKLWRNYMRSDDNIVAPDTLKTKRLEYSFSFIDYRVFTHGFTDDLPATKIYLPWQGTLEQTTVIKASSGYLSPFKMTCHKLMIRTPAMDTGATDIVFGIDKVDSGDTTIDSICTYDATATWADSTNFTINRSDWSANPVVESGDLVGISLQADNTNIVTSEKSFHITSVWKVEVVI
tara:strand:- start:225 stop:905 length:681 start_codon:yes stop_codon:yes gene_type:complete